MVKTVISIFGILISVIGIVGTLLAYVLLAPSINGGQDVVMQEMLAVDVALGGVESFISNSSFQLDQGSLALAAASSAMSDSASAYQDTAVSLDAIANNTSDLSVSSPLKKAKESLIAASGKERDAANSLGSYSATMGQSSNALKKTRTDLAKVRRDLKGMTGNVQVMFDAIRNLFLAMTALMLLVLFVILSFSVSSAL